jgi:hypothetical protein
VLQIRAFHLAVSSAAAPGTIVIGIPEFVKRTLSQNRSSRRRDSRSFEGQGDYLRRASKRARGCGIYGAGLPKLRVRVRTSSSP